MRMTNYVKALGVALAVALLAVAPVAAQEAEAAAPPEEGVTLTGQLSADDQGGYVLIDEASGESVPLVSATDLSQYVDTTVNITGQWADDSEGNKTFEVASIEPAEAG